MRSGKRSQGFVIGATCLGVVAAFLVGCSMTRDTLQHEAQAESRPPKFEKPQDYLIQPGDELDIKFFYNPELNETVFVRPDGKISLQLVDDVRAAGLTPSQLDEDLTRMYVQELRKPVITVIVKSFTGQQVYVGGEVVEPGLVELMPSMTALQAVFSVEGFKETAKPEGVIVIRKGQNNRPIPLRVDLKAVMNGESVWGDIQLQPSDIVYVPKTWIAKANLFVKQYIADLFLYRGISLGYSFGTLD